MWRKLMRVTDASALVPGFCELEPMFSAMGTSDHWPGWSTLPDNFPPQGIVEVRRPDGSVLRASYTVASTHFNWVDRLSNPAWTCSVALKDVAKDAVPVGSEIWYEPTEEHNGVES